MASEGASADSEKKPDTDTKPAEVEPEHATGATGASGATEGATASSLGERQVQAKSAVGPADDPAEKAADASADRVMRMSEPKAEPPAGAGATEPTDAGTTGPAGAGAVGEKPASPPAGDALPEVRRAVDPSAEKPPAAAAAAPAPTASGPAAPGAEPVAPASPESEPPAPDGEPPARSAPEVSEKTQKYLEASAGTGMPLPEKARKYFETRMQHDLGHVGVHDDAASDEAARAIDALAFTRGNDIYFRSGAFDPESEAGKRLLAHELAHVAQQRPGINRKPAPGPSTGSSTSPVIRRAPPTPATPATSATGDLTSPRGKIDTSKPSLELDELPIPAWKTTEMGVAPFVWNKAPRADKHRANWEAATKGDPVDAVKEKAKETKQPGPTFAFAWKSPKGDVFFVGTPADIASRLTRPQWTKKGESRPYDVDHKREWQLGGTDAATNLWLLDASMNRSIGPVIAATVNREIGLAVKEAQGKVTKPPKSVDEVKQGYAVTFTRVGTGPKGGPSKAIAYTRNFDLAADVWTQKDLKSPDVAAPLTALTPAQEKEALGTETSLVIYDKQGGGRPVSVPYDGTKADFSKLAGRSKSYEVIGGSYTGGKSPQSGPVGHIGLKFKGSKVVSIDDAPTVDILAMPGVRYGGVLDRKSIYALRDKAKVAGLSPIEFPDLDFEFGGGLMGRGVVKSDIEMLKNTEIAIVMEGSDIAIEATITGESLKLPGPFKVQGGAITLSAGTGGVSVEGDIEFEIEKLAKGKIGAGGSTKSTAPGFAMRGSLDFDTKMFTEAHLGLSYADGKWGVKGKLAVGPDKIKGIKSASAMVTVDDGNVTADGEFETSIKGIEKGKVSFKYLPETGMEIAGEILLGAGIPGVKSGKLDATVKQGTQGYSLAGGITVEPAVPGLTGSITGRYEDGTFQVDADLAYERGIAKGRVKVGVTNQAVTDGKPTGVPTKDGTLTAYGGGEVTLAITPWLQGTVGLQLKPNGQIEVKGKVAMPDHFDVFPEKKVQKRVFSIGIDIPIVGVAVAGQRVGIFATIRGGLDVSAGFGPGQLKGVALEVTYNPDDPGATHVVGMGTFAVPAHAGLRLSVDGGLGAGIPVVSATAGVSVFGEVGLEGEASASAKIDWSPGPGFVLDAKGELSVSPRFKFGIDAFVDVSADLYLTTIELYHQKWKLAAFEYGSDMKFGLVFPIHYEQGKPFDISFDQIEWTYPNIEPGELLGGLMKQLVG